MLVTVTAWIRAHRAPNREARRNEWLLASLAMPFCALFLLTPVLGRPSTLVVDSDRVTIMSRSTVTLVRGEILTMRERATKERQWLELYARNGETRELSFCMQHASDVAKALGMEQVKLEKLPRRWVYKLQ